MLVDYNRGVRFDAKHNCSKIYVCPNDSHKKSLGWHVLVCMRHREQNQCLLNKFKSDMIDKLTFSYSGLYGNHIALTKEDVRDDTVFLLQTIKVGDKPLNLFFDSGCGDMVIRKDAIKIFE